MKRTIILITSLALITSCKKKESTTTGNPMVSLSITSSQNTTPVAFVSIKNIIKDFFFPEAMASAPPTMLDLNGNTVSLDQGWMVVKEIEFKATEIPDANESDGDEIKFLGPYSVNLFSASPVQIGSTSLGLSSIQRIKMKLHPSDVVGVGEPSDLVNNSIYFHGTVGGKMFSFTSTEGTEFEIGGSTALNIRDNMSLILSIRIVPLINKIDLSALANEAPGVVISDSYKVNVISPPPCPSIDASSSTIYDCFRKGLEQQADLGDDSDQSGEIESNEDEIRL